MITCLHCGFENPVNHRFCQNCGKSLEALTQPQLDFIGKQAQPEADAQNSPSTLDGYSDNYRSNPDQDADRQLVERQPEELDPDLSSVDLASEAAISATQVAEPKILTVENDQPQLLAASDPISQVSSAAAEAEAINSIANQIPDDISPDLVSQINFSDSQEDQQEALSAVEKVEEQLINSLSEAEFAELQSISSEPEDTEITRLIQNSANEKAPLQLLRLSYAGITDVGQERDHNEDNFVMLSQVFSTENAAHEVIRDQKGLFVVCDGMGGHDGGEVASAIAIEQIVSQAQAFWHGDLPSESDLKQIILKANQAIFDHNEQESRCDLGRMGTTLILLAIHNTQVAIAHVGDSRIYRVTAQKLEQITRDHEVANRLIDQGMSVAVARARLDAHQLTQALGPFENHQVNPTINYFQLTEPTIFLLCSDGLCDDNVIEENWQTHLLPLLDQQTNLATGVQELVYLGNYLNGHDNITAIAVQCLVGST